MTSTEVLGYSQMSLRDRELAAVSQYQILVALDEPPPPRLLRNSGGIKMRSSVDDS